MDVTLVVAEGVRPTELLVALITLERPLVVRLPPQHMSGQLGIAPESRLALVALVLGGGVRILTLSRLGRRRCSLRAGPPFSRRLYSLGNVLVRRSLPADGSSWCIGLLVEGATLEAFAGFRWTCDSARWLRWDRVQAPLRGSEPCYDPYPRNSGRRAWIGNRWLRHLHGIVLGLYAMRVATCRSCQS